MEKEVDAYKKYSLVNSESLRVSHVCRLWRRVAINTARLWVKIRLPVRESITELDQLWTIVANRANNCPLDVEIVEAPGNPERLIRRRSFILSSWVSSSIHLGELRLSTFVGYVEPFPQTLFNFSTFSSLSIHYRSSGSLGWSVPIMVQDLITRLSSHPSCVRLSLAGIVLQTSGMGALSPKVRLNLHHISIQNCTVAQRDTLSLLIQNCPNLESCVFRNNVHQEPGPSSPTTFPNTLPGTLRLVEMDQDANLSLLFSGQQPVVCPHLATCNVDFNYPYKAFLQANPTIVALTIPPNADITDVASVSPQLQSLKVHRPNDALLICKADGPKDSRLFPHLRELHIHLRAFVSLDTLKELMRPMDSFTPLQVDDSSQLEKLILTWSPRACASQGIRLDEELKPWLRWLEEMGYWDRVVVTRSEKEWRFSWTRAAVSS
jgi:hypothetical protein